MNYGVVAKAESDEFWRVVDQVLSDYRFVLCVTPGCDTCNKSGAVVARAKAIMKSGIPPIVGEYDLPALVELKSPIYAMIVLIQRESRRTYDMKRTAEMKLMCDFLAGAFDQIADLQNCARLRVA